MDGGSTDDTVQRLIQGFEKGDFTPPSIIIQRCNIAEGRNLAIKNTTNEIIVSLDAGSIPEPQWLEQIALPFPRTPGYRHGGGQMQDCPGE